MLSCMHTYISITQCFVARSRRYDRSMMWIYRTILLSFIFIFFLTLAEGFQILASLGVGGRRRAMATSDPCDQFPNENQHTHYIEEGQCFFFGGSIIIRVTHWTCVLCKLIIRWVRRVDCRNLVGPVSLSSDPSSSAGPPPFSLFGFSAFHLLLLLHLCQWPLAVNICHMSSVILHVLVKDPGY